MDEYGKPIPFASIGIVDRAIGTISNEEGKFKLLLPSSLNEAVLSISHVGYSRLQLSLASVITQKSFVLKEQMTMLDEVVITDISAAALMLSAIDKIPENYYMEPLTYQFYMSNKRWSNERPALLLEVVCYMYRSHESSGSAKFEFAKLRGKPMHKDFKDDFDNARSTLINVIKYKEIERRGSWNLSHRETKFYEYNFGDAYTKDELQIQIVYAKPNQLGKKKEYNEMVYHIDLESHAIVSIEEIGEWHSWITYKRHENKWILESFKQIKDNLQLRNLTSFEIDVIVTNVEFGENTEIVPLGYRYVQEVKHRLGDWDDSFWENYNYVPLDSIWR